MWDPPWLGIEPVSPALAGKFFTTEPSGKPQHPILLNLLFLRWSQRASCYHFHAAFSFESLHPWDWFSVEMQVWSHLSSCLFFFPPNQIFFTSKRSEHAQWWESLIDGGIHLGYFKASSHRKPKKYPLNFSCWSLSWTLFISPKRSLFCVALFFPPLCGPDSICHYLDIEHFLQIKEKITSGKSQIQAYWRLDDTANH